MGFASLKDFSAEFFERIVAERKTKGKFKSWEDLLTRTKNY
jgi:DNA uptake protein ComE-like DNA-binding protein